MPVLFGIDSTLLLGAAIAVIICIAAGLVVRKLRARVKFPSHKISLDPSRAPFRVQKIPASGPNSSSDGEIVPPSTSRRKRIDCLAGKADLGESLSALAEKYSLEEITLATSDGLLLASSQKTPPTDAVARYAMMYAENEQPRPPGIILFGMEHKGSFLVGIAKTKDLFGQDPDEEMVRETKDILNRWI
jgi:hypothetical protein